MKRLTIALVGFLAVMISKSNAEEVYTPEGYTNQGSPGAVSVYRPMTIVHDQLSAFPANMEEGSPRLELKSYLDRADRLVIDVTQTGLLDDSISGENRVYIFKRSDAGRFVVWGYGYRHLCARAETIEEWTTDKCP